MLLLTWPASGSWFMETLSRFGDLVFFFAAKPQPSREYDRHLVHEALSGDEGFDKLVQAHEQMVYRVAFRFLNDETDAADVTQEVFLKVYRTLHRFRGDSSLSTWLYAITANLSRNAIRNRKNRGKLQVLTFPPHEDGHESVLDRAEDKSAGVHRLLENREIRDAIQKAVAELPPEFKEAVVLRDLEGLDYGQITQVLKINLGTLKSRIARGRALLREQLKDWL